MTNDEYKRSPVFPAGARWDAKPDSRYYESELTAMIRKMLEDSRIREDQEWAWHRWRSGDNAIKHD